MTNTTPPEIPSDALPVFNSNGLTIPDYSAIVEALQTMLFSVYGDDVNFDVNSAAGQIVNIIGKLANDINTLNYSLLDSTNVYTAKGVILDDIATQCGAARKSATFTFQNIELIVTSNCNLTGLDGQVNSLTGTGFTVSDSAGVKYILATSQTGLTTGVYTLAFRCEQIGEVRSLPNTINNIVTNVNGVQAVDNSEAPFIIGSSGESDVEFRERIILSQQLNSQGSVSSIMAKLYKLFGVVSVVMDNNVTSVTNSHGTPAHSVWTIVQGGAEQDIAEVLADNISMGCGLRGSISKTVSTDQGNIIIAFDRPVVQLFNVTMTLTLSANSGVTSAIIPELVADFVASTRFNIGKSITQGEIVEAMLTSINKLAPSQIGVTTCTLSSDDNATQVGVITPANINVQFALSTDKTTVTIA